MAESKKKCRQYSVKYLKFDFLPSKADKRLPTCLLSNKVLSNDSMKPSKLEDYLRRCHPDKIADKCKDDWDKLRNAYINALKRRKNKKSGQAAVLVTPWKYEEQMSFLQPFIKSRPSTTNLMAPPDSPECLETLNLIENSPEPESPQSDHRPETPQSGTSSHATRFEDILSMKIPPWIINPFDETEVENVILQEELLELSTNEEPKVTFKTGYQKFWLQAEIPEKYP
ncbi:hypothetical protein EVAR_96340_1 [Eumeta japonica]|uniref:MADF domain-containing protein n=1 Tax=Eumeta variegata TaxID=151549 RepID=A0A4C1VV95_EUMVA|nr:hypothetical protein EVAR_96340_1 [Eumeta japonica]